LSSKGIRRRCLLIAPLTFYTFHETVKAALEDLNYDVDLLNEEYPANTLGKLLAKCLRPLVRMTTLSALRVHLATHPTYDLVLIIKGRGLSPKAIDLLKQHANRVIGYNFDSFRLNASPLDWHSRTDRFATFDVVDSEVYGIPLVHLFSSAEGMLADLNPLYDVSIVMKVHSNRLAYVDRFMQSLVGRSMFVFLFERNWATFLFHFLRAPGPALRLRRYISFKPLSYIQAMKAIASSRATLDYAHPLQSGITVRCFEAQSMGVPVITNNPHVISANVFPSGSVVTFLGDSDPAELAQSIGGLAAGRGNPVYRSTRCFVSELIEEEFPDQDRKD
jgi:hypothetical protein